MNVGPYGLGKTPGGQNYDVAFMNNPSNLTYSTSNSSKWGGCVIEGAYPDDIEDHDGPWNMYRYCRTSTGSRIKYCDPARDSNYTSNNQNYLCPKTPLTPMTNNKTELVNSIRSLKAEGNTYINNGLTWGLRLISPEYPFTEGESWNNQDWKKATS